MNYRRANNILCLVGTISYGIGWYFGGGVYYFIFGLCFGQIWVNYRREKSEKDNE